MKRIIEKADILVEALPYIKEFYNKTVVIKYGGNAMVDEELKKNFAIDVVLLKYIGINPIIIHGGGPQIGEILEKMGKQQKFFNGLRVTDNETMNIVEMVLVGKVNKEIVSLINHHGGRAVGLSGKDGGLIKAKKYNVTNPNAELGGSEIIDLGMVGEIVSITPSVLNTLYEGNFIPVIAPVGVGDNGKTYNINADSVAGAISSAINAEKLVLLTDVEGIMNKQNILLSTLSREEIEKLIAAETIKGGMLPKVMCCLEALSSGVKKTHIINGKIKHAVLLEIFTKEGIGTEIIHQ